MVAQNNANDLVLNPKWRHCISNDSFGRIRVGTRITTVLKWNSEMNWREMGGIKPVKNGRI